MFIRSDRDPRGNSLQDHRFRKLRLAVENLIMRPAWRRLLLVGWVLVATGCTTMQMGYSMLPTIARWQLSDYVSLDARQQAIVDRHLTALHDWHQRTQLPAYVAFLEAIGERITLAQTVADTAHPGQSAARAVSAEELRQWRLSIGEAVGSILLRLADPVAQVAVTLTPAQLTSIEQELDRRNRKLKGEYEVDDPRRRQARIDHWRERIESNIGPLTERQQALLARRMLDRSNPTDWWAIRLARQQRTLASLRDLAGRKPPPEQARAQVMAALNDYLNPADASEGERRERSMTESEAILAEVFAIATPAQYRFARERFKGLAGELREIAGLPAAVASASAAGVGAPRPGVGSSTVVTGSSPAAVAHRACQSASASISSTNSDNSLSQVC